MKSTTAHEVMPHSISIVTATLNSERELPRLFDSLRAQSDRKFEHVVVDGGSIDDTWKIVEAHRDVVTYAVTEPDNGVYDALNKGIRSANTDYYLVMGADDVLFPNAIAEFKEVLGAADPDVVVAAVRAGSKIRRGFRPWRAWLGHSGMVTSHSVGMLIRKSLHKQFGYYSPKYPLLADGYFIKRVCLSVDVKVVSAEFISGEFGVRGVSNRQLARALSESWQVQLDTGENPFTQYLLFQYRLIRYLPKLLRRAAP